MGFLEAHRAIEAFLDVSFSAVRLPEVTGSSQKPRKNCRSRRLAGLPKSDEARNPRNGLHGPRLTPASRRAGSLLEHPKA